MEFSPIQKAFLKWFFFKKRKFLMCFLVYPVITWLVIFVNLLYLNCERKNDVAFRKLVRLIFKFKQRTYLFLKDKLKIIRR